MERASHQPLFSQAPLAQLALAFSTGVVFAHYLSIPFVVLIPCGLALALTALLALTKQKLSSSAMCLVAAMLFAGMIVEKNDNGNIPRNQLKQLLDEKALPAGDPLELTGVIDGAVDFALDRVYFTLRIEQIQYKGVYNTTSGTVALIAWLQKAETLEQYTRLELCHGARLRVTTTLRRADNYRNPGVPLFTEYLDRKGYDATGFVKSPLLIQRLGDERVLPPISWLYQWRQTLQQEIDRRFSRDA